MNWYSVLLLWYQQEHGDNYYYGGGMFLILFISIGTFIFANLVVAVVVTNLECAVKDVKKEEEEQAKELELKVRFSFIIKMYMLVRVCLSWCVVYILRFSGSILSWFISSDKHNWCSFSRIDSVSFVIIRYSEFECF